PDSRGAATRCARHRLPRQQTSKADLLSMPERQFEGCRNSILQKEISMKEKSNVFGGANNRRSFLKNGMVAAGAATMSAALLPGAVQVFGREEEDHSPITKSDIAILTFLSALEQVEADLWIQYAELGGATNQGLSPIDLPFATGLAPAYITGLLVLDGDMPQYIADNTDDEISHHAFLNNYLESKGAKQ